MPKDLQLQTISVNLPRSLVKRVRSLGFNQEISVSSIIERSLEAFLGGMTEEQSAARLRGLGATLRRTG